jgi:hypothetical protein
MKTIIRILKERASGLFLLLFAVVIIAGFLANSRKAQSNQELILTSENTISDQSQILGEYDETVEEAPSIAGKIDTSPEETVIDDKEAGQDLKTSPCDDLGERLKKYCGKKFDVKKCKKYLIEAKEGSKDDAVCKKLYKKYHFEKKEEKKSDKKKSDDDSAGTGNDLKNEESILIVDTGSNSKSYEVASRSGSVLEMMDLLQSDKNKNFSYHASSGFVDKINGLENQGDMSWMLYACKSGTCKLSSVGASDCKIGDWEKIEWRYVDWTKITWETW